MANKVSLSKSLKPLFGVRIKNNNLILESSTVDGVDAGPIPFPLRGQLPEAHHFLVQLPGRRRTPLPLVLHGVQKRAGEVEGGQHGVQVPAVCGSYVRVDYGL